MTSQEPKRYRQFTRIFSCSVKSSLGTRLVWAWERRIPRPLNCFQKQRVGYRVGQGFVSRNASRNTRGRVQGEVLLVPLISCLNETTPRCVRAARTIIVVPPPPLHTHTHMHTHSLKYLLPPLLLQYPGGQTALFAFHTSIKCLAAL